MFSFVVSTPVATSSTVEECFLCESPVDVQFEPCGHAMMCSTCAQRAKKCPQCKVKSINYITDTHRAAFRIFFKGGQNSRPGIPGEVNSVC